jgi:OCT family organic cation transporter-like MFS transporter 4/5
VFDLVCGNDWKITLAQVVYMFGILVGASTSGMISDKFGRKKTIIFFSTAMSAFSIAVAFANCYDFFVFLRWGLAFSSVGFWTTFYVYAMEMVGGKWKTLFGIGFEYPWALAYSTLPGIAYVVRNWSHLQLIISVPPIIFLIIYHFIPESPRWLLSQGRVEEAKIILEKAGKTNGRQWPENLVLEGKSKDPEAGSGATILDLFKTPNLRKNTLIQYFNWFTASFVYYALTFDSGSLIPDQTQRTP